MNEPITIQFRGEVTVTLAGMRALAEQLGANARPAPSPPAAVRALKVDETAQMLGVSRSTVYELMKRGEITALHVGRSLRFRSDLLEDYIRRQSDVAR